MDENKEEMKEMVYSSVRITEVLAHDTYKGYEFFIVSYGTHPCAYIVLTETSKFYGRHYKDRIFDDLNLHVHGGITYSGFRKVENKPAYMIGWDYSHWNDFSGSCLELPDIPGFAERLWPAGRRWTTDEVFEEVKEVIDEMIKEEDDE